MKKIIAVVWRTLTGGENGGDARPHPNPLPRGEGGIVPRFLEDASNGMGRTGNRQTSDGLWSSPLLGERARVRADVPASHPFIFKPGIPLATTVSILTAGWILSCASVCKGALIAGWNFNSQTSGAAPTPITADHGSRSLDLSHLANESADATIGGSSSGTSVNKVSGDANGNDFFVAAGTSLVENGKSMIFSLSTSGYQNIVLTYATERSASSFTTQQWSYSTDGINYTSFGSAISVPTTTYTMETVDFTGTSAVNNDSIVYFELTLSGATANTGGDHFDNIQFNADAVPEPPEWGAIPALGLMGICGLREWRQRRCGEKLKSCPVK